MPDGHVHVAIFIKVPNSNSSVLYSITQCVCGLDECPVAVPQETVPATIRIAESNKIHISVNQSAPAR